MLNCKIADRTIAMIQRVVEGHAGEFWSASEKLTGEAMAEPAENTTICILGMHRSGTSCLAGSLQERGLFLGDVVDFAKFNRRGNKENLTCMKINNDIMALNGGSWDNPPKTMTWNDDLRARRDAHVTSYASCDIWGFKDPRAVFTLPFWLEALPDMRFVGTFRHPQAVARSLLSRGDNLVPAVPPLELWRRYNRKLLAHVIRFDIPLLNFDWPEQQYARAIDSIAADLGLKPEAGAPLEFYEKSLRTSDGDDDSRSEVTAEDLEIYNKLRDHAIPID